MATCEFHNFPYLPSEIRLTIWAYTLPPPRVVEIEWNRYLLEWICTKESQGKPCALLHANKESRQEYLEAYFPLFPQYPSLNFTYNIDPISIPTSKLPIAYINPGKDTLFIGRPYGGDYGLQQHPKPLALVPSLATLRYLACDFERLNYVGDEHHLISQFQHLEVFTMVVDDTREHHFSAVGILAGELMLTELHEGKDEDEKTREVTAEVEEIFAKLRRECEDEGHKRLPHLSIKRISQLEVVDIRGFSRTSL